MRLSDFIIRDMENILATWEAFAAGQLPAAARMDSLELRDHAQQILEAVARDITTPQTRAEQTQKSQGRAPHPIDAVETAAETHALLRARSNFNIVQMMAEYRALRSSVLTRWADACEPAAANMEDVTRFNEALDQAIMESVASFSKHVEQARDFFLGMLGHDMRNPLDAIQLTAGYLAKLNAGETVSVAASRIMRSGGRMQALLDDLTDFNRGKLGLGLNIAPVEIDLADVVVDEVQQLRIANPGRILELTVDGDTKGVWDPNRLHQLFGNLVSNALKYGEPEAPVRVTLSGLPGEVVFGTRNLGSAIDASHIAQIFDPLKRGPNRQGSQHQDGSLGLGLFISREIVTAHRGEICAESKNGETVFTVRLPRDRRAQPRLQNLRDDEVSRVVSDRLDGFEKQPPSN